MGNVVASTPGAPDGSVAATVTIDPTPLGKVDVEAELGTSNTVQDIGLNATGGTFTLTYGGNTTAPLAYDAPSVTVANALKALAGSTCWRCKPRHCAVRGPRTASGP